MFTKNNQRKIQLFRILLVSLQTNKQLLVFFHKNIANNCINDTYINTLPLKKCIKVSKSRLKKCIYTGKSRLKKCNLAAKVV